MSKKIVSVALGAMLLALPFQAGAQQPKKVWRIGYLSNSDPATESARAEGIRLAGVLMSDNQKRIVGVALKSRLPSMYINREFVEAGGLMSYGADQADSYRRVAYFVDRILQGAKPAELPVEQPTKFEFVINLKTAKQIGLTIPPDVLARATKLIR
jgi:putative ABC transport system substrate-binding protein